MRKTLPLSLAVLAVWVAPLVAAPTAFLTGSSLTFPKAPYTVHLVGGLDEWAAYGITSNFQTFCVQSQVIYQPGRNNVYYASIEDTILLNPNTGLTDTVKQVYAAFLNDAFVDSGYNGNDIQMTIWDSLGMSAPGGAAGTSFLADFEANVGNYDISGWQYVKVLNLWKDPQMTQEVQSQLVQVIPAPGAILLTGAGTLLVGLLRRRSAI